MWWPFDKRKKQPAEKRPSDLDMVEARIAALRAWRDVGEAFEYLGRRMVVIAHSRVEVWPGYHFPTIHLVPEVHARYADAHGQVHTLVLSEAEVLALANASQNV